MRYFATIAILFALLISLGCTRDSDRYSVVMTVETDKPEYMESDTVFFKIYIANYGPSVVKMITYQIPAYNVFVYWNAEEKWNWMWDKYAYQPVVVFHIQPRDTLIFGEEYPIYWTQMGYDSTIVLRGTYTAEADITTDCKMQSIRCSFILK